MDTPQARWPGYVHRGPRKRAHARRFARADAVHGFASAWNVAASRCGGSSRVSSPAQGWPVTDRSRLALRLSTSQTCLVRPAPRMPRVESGPPTRNRVRPRLNRGCRWLEGRDGFPAFLGLWPASVSRPFEARQAQGHTPGLVRRRILQLFLRVLWALWFLDPSTCRALGGRRTGLNAPFDGPDGTLAGQWPAIESRSAKAGGERGNPMDREVCAGHAVK